MASKDTVDVSKAETKNWRKVCTHRHVNKARIQKTKKSRKLTNKPDGNCDKNSIMLCRGKVTVLPILSAQCNDYHRKTKKHSKGKEAQF